MVNPFKTATKIKADIFNNQHKDKALAMVLDITKPEQIDNTFQFIKEKFGRIDMFGKQCRFRFNRCNRRNKYRRSEKCFEANFFGTLKLTQAFLPLFREQKGGHIIQISSHGGFKAFAGFGIYNASKFAVEGFSKALAQEIAPFRNKADDC